MNGHQHYGRFPPFDLSRPPPGRPPGMPPDIPQSFLIPPPQPNQAPRPYRVPKPLPYFKDVVTNPYAHPCAEEALRQRVLSTRLDWNHNPDLQNKFSDSEFSDNSVASTDGFVRTTGFRYGNAASRGRKLEASNARLGHDQLETKPGLSGVVAIGSDDRSRKNLDNRGVEKTTKFTDASIPRSNGSFNRSRGRGLRDQLPTRPGHIEHLPADPRRTTELEEISDWEAEDDLEAGTRVRGPNRNGSQNSNNSVLNGRSHVPEDVYDNEDDDNEDDDTDVQSLYRSQAEPNLVSASYSLNTDIRNAQDVTASHSGVAFLHDVSSDLGSAATNGYHGRRFVASAHKRYEVIGEAPSNGETEDKPAAALNSLLVQLTSKAKRRDADGREYYIRDEIIPFDEDQFHEFKGHRSMAYDEQPLKSRASASKQRRSSRKPVSLALNAFLNSQWGGTIYLGVLDTGAIKGLMLTPYQKDHVRLQVEDLFSRYEPTVPSHRYQLTFVPVLEGIDLETEIATLDSFDDEEARAETKANKIHQFRTPHYCWCDKDAVALLEFGRIPSQFIIEIEIFSWDPNHPKNPNPFGPDCPNIAPVYEDEMGRVSFRRNASNYSPLVSEILEYAKHQVDQYYLDLIDSLDLEEDNGEDDDRQLTFVETSRDKTKTKLGLNVMEKTVKSLKRNGTWDPRVGEADDDDLQEHVRVKTFEEEPNLMSVDATSPCLSPMPLDITLASEMDRLLEIGEADLPVELKPTI